MFLRTCNVTLVYMKVLLSGWQDFGFLKRVSGWFSCKHLVDGKYFLFLFLFFFLKKKKKKKEERYFYSLQLNNMI